MNIIDYLRYFLEITNTKEPRIHAKMTVRPLISEIRIPCEEIGSDLVILSTNRTTINEMDTPTMFEYEVKSQLDGNRDHILTRGFELCLVCNCFKVV